MTITAELDVLIIGAGPAGSAAATVLAEKGSRVLILEREKFPRYHVGESLLPFTFEPLQRLGMIEKMRASHFIKKYSVQLVSPSGRASQPFYFFDRYDRNSVAQTWQVLRSEFDLMLLNNAREKGARVLEEMKVTQLLKADGRVIGARAQAKDGSVQDHHAKITLDCSGKESFAATRNGWRIPDPYLNKVAVWTYYEGAQRDPGIDEGATTVAYVPDKGWFWYIPQHDNRISVGVVAEGKYLSRGGIKSPEAMFQREVGEEFVDQALIHLAVGKQTGPYYLTSEFSYHTDHCATEGLLLAGDAFCFLDPVFSSGVMFALRSGVSAADAIDDGLRAGDLSPGRFIRYGQSLRTGVENMRKLVYAFYDHNFSFRTLTNKYPEAASGLVTRIVSPAMFARITPNCGKWVGEFVKLPSEMAVGAPEINKATAGSEAAVC